MFGELGLGLGLVGSTSPMGFCPHLYQKVTETEGVREMMWCHQYDGMYKTSPGPTRQSRASTFGIGIRVRVRVKAGAMTPLERGGTG